MTVRREILQNDSQTTLDGALNNSDTSFSVDDGSVFPTTGDFRVLLDSEIMLCTARSGNTLTVVRAQEGTTAASHPDSTPVIHVLTEDALERYCRDDIVQFNSQRPPLRIVDGSGNVLTKSSFTQLDGGTTATFLDLSAGGIAIDKPGAANQNLSGIFRAAPATPYSVVAAMSFVSLGGTGSVQAAGLCFRESGTGKVLTQQYRTDDNRHQRVAVQRYTDLTTFDGTDYGANRIFFPGTVFWQKIEDDGTDLKFFHGLEGEVWKEFYSTSRTAFMAGGPDQIGFHITSTNTNVAGNFTVAALYAWDEGA